MTTSHSSRCWKSFYMNEEDLLWVWSGLGFSIICNSWTPWQTQQSLLPVLILPHPNLVKSAQTKKRRELENDITDVMTTTTCYRVSMRRCSTATWPSRAGRYLSETGILSLCSIISIQGEGRNSAYRTSWWANNNYTKWDNNDPFY